MGVAIVRNYFNNPAVTSPVEWLLWQRDSQQITCKHSNMIFSGFTQFISAVTKDSTPIWDLLHQQVLSESFLVHIYDESYE